MDNASCKTTAIALVIYDISENIKLDPMFKTIDIKNIIKVYLDIKNSKKVSDITRLPKPYQKVKQQIQSYKMTY